MKLIIGLSNLLIPFDSKIDASRNTIEMIGAISYFPGSINQKAPKIPKMTGMKKNLMNLLSTNFDKE